MFLRQRRAGDSEAPAARRHRGNLEGKFHYYHHIFSLKIKINVIIIYLCVFEYCERYKSVKTFRHGEFSQDCGSKVDICVHLSLSTIYVSH